MATQTCTVLFTDLAGYTAAVARSDREQLRQLLLDHEALVEPVVSRYHGRVVKNLGDSFLCLFSSATDALRAAVDILERLGSTDSLNMRLALATGDVEPIDGDVFGETVNLAARVLSKTPAGEIWFSAGTHLCMNASEVPWEEVGTFHLKGIVGPQQVYRAVTSAICKLPPPVLTAAREGRLWRVRRGVELPTGLPTDAVILLEGFVPGSVELEGTVQALPSLDASSLWLAAWHITPADRFEWTDQGRGLVVGTPESLEAAIERTRRQTLADAGSDTLVFDLDNVVDMELVLSGLALPAVPFAQVVSAYSYELLSDGRWVHGSDRAAVRVDVSATGAVLMVLQPGVLINGRACSTGHKESLAHDTRIQVGDLTHTFRALESEHYLGVLVADSHQRLGVLSGQKAEIGRDPAHPGLTLADRPGQANLRWCSGSVASRARQTGFTLDRALVGRHQASFCLTEGGVELVPLHGRCPTYIMTSAEHALQRVTGPTMISLGDDVVVGTSVVGVRPG